eukprot:scaffold10474_cov122-Isochrysis_galbana.AAC.10
MSISSYASDSSAASQPHSQDFSHSTPSRQSGMVQPVIQEMYATVHAAGSSLFGLFSSCSTFDSTASPIGGDRSLVAGGNVVTSTGTGTGVAPSRIRMSATCLPIAPPSRHAPLTRQHIRPNQRRAHREAGVGTEEREEERAGPETLSVERLPNRGREPQPEPNRKAKGGASLRLAHRHRAKGSPSDTSATRIG